MTAWWQRATGPGSLRRLHHKGWLARLFHRTDTAPEVYEARAARAELSSLLKAATDEADAIMARLDGPKAGRHGSG